MGAKCSKMVFEYINNVLIIIGAGPLGLMVFVKNGLFSKASFLKPLAVASVTAASLFYVFVSPPELSTKTSPSLNKLVVITGCDSGLGYSMAHHICEMGFAVLAGCLNLNSDGAKELQQLFGGGGDQITLLELDVTSEESIGNCLRVAETYLSENENAVLWALINNAGVMVFGEFEWYTERLIKHQVDVNLLGTMNITKAFLPLLRKYSGRVLTISSHCANATLPGLAVYGATKAALAAWSDGLRIEQAKYGVHVLTFIPGSFVQQSNIMAKQNENVFEMQSSMTPEQTQFYGDYFRIYNSYLSSLSGTRKPKKICDDRMYDTFERALLEMCPRATYKHESLRYKLYHILFKISPVRLRDYFVIRFVQMPEWNPEKKIQTVADIIG